MAGWLRLPVGVFLAGLSTLGACIAILGPASVSGWAYVAVSVLLAAAWWSARWSLLLAASALLLVTFAARAVATLDHDSIALVTLPEQTGARWLSAMIEERDGSLPVAEVLPLPADGGRPLPGVIRDAYDRMAEGAGMVPSPAVATYLGLQSPERFDAIVIRPRVAKPRGAVVFLHGFAGNFTVYCWHMAQAAPSFVVVCPSIGPQGDWWEPHGHATVRATLDYLDAQGIDRVFLAGLSNGAAGACAIAPAMGRRLSGLILLSGALPKAPRPRMPLLVVHGTRDAMMPVGLARAYFEHADEPKTFVSLEGNHFVMLDRWPRVREAIADWLLGAGNQRARPQSAH